MKLALKIVTQNDRDFVDVCGRGRKYLIISASVI